MTQVQLAEALKQLWKEHRRAQPGAIGKHDRPKISQSWISRIESGQDYRGLSKAKVDLLLKVLSPSLDRAAFEAAVQAARLTPDEPDSIASLINQLERHKDYSESVARAIADLRATQAGVQQPARGAPVRRENRPIGRAATTSPPSHGWVEPIRNTAAPGDAPPMPESTDQAIRDARALARVLAARFDEVSPSTVRLGHGEALTLALIARRQPITRTAMDAALGGSAGPSLSTLLDQQLITIQGRAEDIGRPLLYGTTRRFLELLNWTSLADLPTESEIAELAMDAPATSDHDEPE